MVWCGFAGSGCPGFSSFYRFNRSTSHLRGSALGKLSDATLPAFIFPFFAVLFSGNKFSGNKFSIPAYGTCLHRWGVYSTFTLEDGFPTGNKPHEGVANCAKIFIIDLSYAQRDLPRVCSEGGTHSSVWHLLTRLQVTSPVLFSAPVLACSGFALLT